MKYYCFLSMLCISAWLFSSCEGCVKSATKKATKIGMSAIEGVSEAVSENGEQISEQAMDALGSVAKGAGKSIDRQLDEHAEYVASVAGRTFVQSVEGFDQGLTKEYYDPIPYSDDFVSGVNLDFFGKIKSKALLDAYFLIMEKGTYNCIFSFTDDSEKPVMQKEAVIEKTETPRKYSVVSFALNSAEEKQLAATKIVKIKITKK